MDRFQNIPDQHTPMRFYKAQHFFKHLLKRRLRLKVLCHAVTENAVECFVLKGEAVRLGDQKVAPWIQVTGGSDHVKRNIAADDEFYFFSVGFCKIAYPAAYIQDAAAARGG